MPILVFIKHQNAKDGDALLFDLFSSRINRTIKLQICSFREKIPRTHQDRNL